MNHTPEQLDLHVDRLVDGELSPSEFRELLGSLDQQPGGWRRCALAFVEAQTLRRELPQAIQAAPQSAAASDDAPAAPATSPRRGDGGRKVGAKQVTYYLALAASVGAAFYLGTWSNTPGNGSSQLAQNVTMPRTDVVAPSTERATNVVDKKPAPIGNVQLVMDGADSDQPVSMPVFDAKDLGADWQAGQKPAIPQQLVEQLEQAGHRVDRQQQWMRVQLDDGRQLCVPIEEYRIRPAERPAY